MCGSEISDIIRFRKRVGEKCPRGILRTGFLNGTRRTALHEYALPKRIVDIINRAAGENGAKRVNSATLMIGENTGIMPDSVQVYFEIIAQGTPAQDAKLHLNIVQTQMHCKSCNKNFVKPRFSFTCPHCGALGSPTETGNECFVESVELEV